MCVSGPCARNAMGDRSPINARVSVGSLTRCRVVLGRVCLCVRERRHQSRHSQRLPNVCGAAKDVSSVCGRRVRDLRTRRACIGRACTCTCTYVTVAVARASGRVCVCSLAGARRAEGRTPARGRVCLAHAVGRVWIPNGRLT